MNALLAQAAAAAEAQPGFLSTLDLVIFFGSLLAIMAVGLWVGRKEEDTEDYYLAGRQTRWWGVAGSVFGSNVSANHVAGMMGVGFAIGFAQSHFEITAIAGLLMLCYVFLPMYRKLNVFTLSQYLEKRYNTVSAVAYTIIMVAIIVVAQMVPGFYFGSRSVNELLQGTTGNVDPTNYKIGIIIMAIVTGTYTIIGGLKAVIVTDVIQSVLVLIAGLLVAFVTFGQPEIGGWFKMVGMDAVANGGEGRMTLYEPSTHPGLPWTGVLSGLMILHFFYWGANQFIVQRALAARSLAEARKGIIAAGFFKLLIPFFSIGTGIAAYYLFKQRGIESDQDAVFITLLQQLIAPLGFGLVGLVAAGLIGAILSSLDSMMNSAATLLTFDIYKRFINPDASERGLIWAGRVLIACIIFLAALLTIVIMDPNSKDSFFLYVANHQGKMMGGLVTAFLIGMAWKRATGIGAIVCILSCIAFSYGVPWIYDVFFVDFAADGSRLALAEQTHPLTGLFGTKLNFFHAIVVACALAALLHVIVSLLTSPSEEKAKYTWVGMELFKPGAISRFLVMALLTLVAYAVLAMLMVKGALGSTTTAFIAAALTLAVIVVPARLSGSGKGFFTDDKTWAGLLAASAIFMMYFFY